MTHDLIVIGSGMAGLAAARQALRLGLRTAMLEQQTFGGLVIGVNELDGSTYTGSGSDLATGMMLEVSELGVESLFGAATSVELQSHEFGIGCDADLYRARAVVIASGGTPRKLGVPGEAELEYRGVGHCADCDGPMLHGKDAVVVGGGDGALQSALTLARFCRRVHIVHRRSAFGAKPHLVRALLASVSIQTHWSSVVDRVLGEHGVTGARIRSVVDGSTSDIACAGFFAYVGLEPATGFLPDSIARDELGKLTADMDRQLSISGIFAAGAVRSGCGSTVADAIADGELAAHAVAARLRRAPHWCEAAG